MESVWNDERVKLLRKLWPSAMSATEIAAKLGCFSHCTDGGRSAVIGKAHRLKLLSKMTVTSRRRGSVKMRAPAWKPNAVIPAVQEPWQTQSAPLSFAVDDPSFGPATILLRKDGKLHPNDALKSRSCRWPVGDPLHHDFHFCGKFALARAKGPTYCDEHFRKAYVSDTVKEVA